MDTTAVILTLTVQDVQVPARYWVSQKARLLAIRLGDCDAMRVYYMPFGPRNCSLR